MFRRPLLRNRLQAIETRIGPADPVDLAYPENKRRFLELIANDPLYSALIEPQFSLVQIRLRTERGMSLDDLAIPAGVPTVEINSSVPVAVPAGKHLDPVWLCLDPAAAPIREALDQVASYLDWVWEKAST